MVYTDLSFCYLIIFYLFVLISQVCHLTFNVNGYSTFNILAASNSNLVLEWPIVKRGTLGFYKVYNDFLFCALFFFLSARFPINLFVIVSHNKKNTYYIFRCLVCIFWINSCLQLIWLNYIYLSPNRFS